MFTLGVLWRSAAAGRRPHAGPRCALGGSGHVTADGQLELGSLIIVVGIIGQQHSYMCRLL